MVWRGWRLLLHACREEGGRLSPSGLQLAEWLADNEPVTNLRMALEFRGFIDAHGRPLDAAFAGQRAALSARQLAVVRAWQRTDREYELAQAVARSRVDLDRMPPPAAASALEFQQELDDAIETGRLPFDLTVYRGIRSLRRALGVDDPAELVDGPRSFEGFTATSVLRRVAVEEFTAPSGALMEVAVPAGTKALWVAGIGSRRLRRQGELLLQDNLKMRIVRRESEYGLCILSMEVLPT